MDDFVPLAHALNHAGLNRQHVFDCAALPADIRATLSPTGLWRQLILIGHVGRRLWDCVQAAKLTGPDPIDDYSIHTVDQLFSEVLPDRARRVIYPGPGPIGLQALGQWAGWHQPSPFMVGIDPTWGSWFAYRIVLLTDSHFLPTPRVDRQNPCLNCAELPCITACPPNALGDGHFNLDTCSNWRLTPDSPCAEGCLARNACPVGEEYRYNSAQIKHSYRQSLAMLRTWRKL